MKANVQARIDRASSQLHLLSGELDDLQAKVDDLLRYLVEHAIADSHEDARSVVALFVDRSAVTADWED